MAKHLSGLPNIPKYKNESKQLGKWEVKEFNLNHAAGYFSMASDYGQGIALLRDNVTWMSITPMEIESHILCHHSAKGTVVIAGLGLGMITLSTLKKSHVKKVYVLEIDETLINGLGDLLADESKSLWDENLSSGRLEILQVNCNSPLPTSVKEKISHADYMWVDTWEYLGSSEGFEKTAYLQHQIKAKTVDFWGLELDLVAELAKISSSDDSATKKRSKFADVVKGFNLPISAKSFNRKALALYFEITMMAAYNAVKIQKERKKKPSIFG